MPPRLGAGGSGGGGVRVRIDGDVTGLQRGLAQAEAAVGRFGGRMDAFGQRMDATGRTLTRNLTLPIVGAGVAAGKLAVDFESSMSKIVGLVGVSRKQVDQWGRDILALAPKVGKGPRELAEAMFFITSAGLRGQAALDALESSAKASAAGLGETMVVADAVTSAVNSYGAANLSAAEATDVLTATVREGKASADTIAPVIGRITPLAAELGVSFNEVGAALAQMTRQGAPAAEASTLILGVMRGLLRPSAEARKGMEEVGLSVDELRRSLRERGLLATLQTMQEAVGGNSAELAKLLPNMEGLRGALAIVGKGAKDAEGIFGRMADTTGAADRAFAAASDTASLRLQKALAGLQARGIELGNRLLPVASDIADGFLRVLDAFDRLPGGAKRAAGAGAIILAGLGPAMRVVGLISRGISGIGSGLGSLAGRGAPTGGIAAGVGRASPIPVFVTNPGFVGGGPGGVVAGRAGGAAGRVGRVVVPGIGALATGGIGAPLLAGGALIGAGVVASRSDFVAGAIPGLMTREQSRRAVRESQDQMVKAWREGGPEMWRKIAEASTGSGILGEAYGRQTANAAQAAIDAFSGTFDRGRGRIKEGTKRVIEISLGELRRLKPEARNLAADSLITMAGELERRGRVPRGTVARLVGHIKREFGELPPAVKRNADLTIDGLRGIPAILRDIAASATAAVSSVRTGLANIRRIVEDESARIRAIGRARRARGAGGTGIYARGGMIPGRFDGRDDVPIRVSRGEVILNPSQQRIVGIDRIVGALRATGGIVGGDGSTFARGGYVDPFPGGTWSGSPAAHRARALGNWQSDNAWDIMGRAGAPVYAVLPGRITRITPSGSSPQFAGEGVYLSTSDGMWWYRHIDAAVSVGQSVPAGALIGRLVSWTAGGPHLHLATDRGDPARARGGAAPTAGAATVANQPGAGEPSLPQLRRFKRGALNVARRLIGRGAVGGRSVSDVLSETITGAQRGSSLREKRRRAFAEGAARSAGITNPDKIRALGEIEVQRLRRQEVGRDVRLVRAAAAKVRKQIARWREHAKKLYKALAKTDPRNRSRIQQLLDGIRNAKDREREAVQELRALIAQAADLQAEAAELDWDIGQLVDEVAQMEDTEPSEVGDTGPSADQQAQLDQTTRRAEVAERQALAGEAFIRAIGSSSDIDPASGSVTIIVNAPGGLVHEQEVGRWVVEALRGQGAPGASVSRSAA